MDLDLDSWATRAQAAYEARIRECQNPPAGPAPFSAVEHSNRLPTGMQDSNSTTTTPLDSPPPPGGRGKRLTPSEQRALVRICAERMDNPDSTAYPKSFWIWVSTRFLETTNRSYSWQSCRRSIGRLVTDRQEYWDAVDEDRSCHNHMESALAAEVDQWMGICLRSHEQLKTPEDMVQRRLRKPPTRFPSVDGETETELRVKRLRVLKWVYHLPDGLPASTGQHQQVTDVLPSGLNPVQAPADSRRWQARSTADNLGSNEGGIPHAETSYLSSDLERTSGLDEEERAHLLGRKRSREHQDDYDDIIVPLPKRMYRSGTLKDREGLGQGHGGVIASKPIEAGREPVNPQASQRENEDSDPLTLATNKVVGRAADAMTQLLKDHLRPHLGGGVKGGGDPEPLGVRVKSIMLDFVSGIYQAFDQFGNGSNNRAGLALANLPTTLATKKGV